MQDAVEDAKSFLLRLVRVLSESPLQCLEMSKTQRGDARRQSWRDMGSKKVQIMKGPLDTPENVPRNAPQEVVGEAIEGAEETSSNGSIVPARGSHDVREVPFKREARKGGDEDAPGLGPPLEGDSRGPEHGG